jgi:hypothetical protein
MPLQDELSVEIPSSERPFVLEFKFIDSSGSATGPRRGRREVRSFVMQNARRQQPWSTSKVGRQPRTSRAEGSNNRGARSSTRSSGPDNGCGMKDIELRQQTASPTPTSISKADHPSCFACYLHVRRKNTKLCVRCENLLRPPHEDFGLDNTSLDPFDTLPVRPNFSVMKLLDHCKWLSRLHWNVSCRVWIWIGPA